MKAISIGLFAIFLMNGAKGQVYDIKTPNNRLNKTPDTGNHTLDSSNYYIWDMINGVWNIPYKEKYNYDTPGNMILKTSYVKDNNKVLAYSVREQYAYDDGGTMTSSYTYKWNQSTGQWNALSKMEFTYNSYGDIDSMIIYIRNEPINQWLLMALRESTYDGMGNLSVGAYYHWGANTSKWLLNDKMNIAMMIMGIFI